MPAFLWLHHAVGVKAFSHALPADCEASKRLLDTVQIPKCAGIRYDEVRGQDITDIVSHHVTNAQVDEPNVRSQPLSSSDW